MLIHPDHIVLVAVVPRVRDLVLARTAHWYRIPYARAAQLLVPDVLAFYQTAVFGAERWSVRYAAPVRGHELVLRRDLLPEEGAHPHAQQPYLKLALGPVEDLPRPLLGGHAVRFTFLLTTGARLLAACGPADLRPTPVEQALLWARADASTLYG